ncbi:MAG: HTH-type transcriptional regulator [Blastococcus sp.]|nr:HTH-type transcriptional regulator [Blastococcus sp.]
MSRRPMLSLMPGAPNILPGFLHGDVRPPAHDGVVALSETDRALVQALQADGRRPFAAIARELSLPEKTVRRRVQELIDSRVIRITTVADPAVLGLTVGALVGVQADGRRSIRALVASLAELESVDYAVITTGRYDALVEVLCRDSAELLAVIDESFLQAPGVHRAEVFPYLRLHYQEPAWNATRSKRDAAPAQSRQLLDAVDRQIVGELNADGRLPFAAVGKSLDMSESQVRKRVTRLVDNGIIRITALADPRSLGFSVQAWVAISTRPGHSVTELAGALTRLPSVAYVVATAGRFDLFAELVCRDTDELMRLVDLEIRSLAGVARTEMQLCLDLYYRPVQPTA